MRGKNIERQKAREAGELARRKNSCWPGAFLVNRVKYLETPIEVREKQTREEGCRGRKEMEKRRNT